MVETPRSIFGGNSPPQRVVPDALFVYQIGERALVGLVEIDRGTERGRATRWVQKIQAYSLLFQSERLREATGFANARLITLVPTAARRDFLAEFMHTNANPALARRCWFAEQSVLDSPGFAQPVWRQPGAPDLQPLLGSSVSAQTE